MATGGLEHRVIRAANVAGEQHGARAIVQPHKRRAGHVARAGQPRLQAGHGLEGLAPMPPGLQQLEAAQGVFLGVQRLRPGVLAEAVPVGVLGFFLLQVARIGQQDAAQVGRGRRAEDLARKPWRTSSGR
jgi:hypothetical protein